jgi:hypothetical protein
MRLAMTHDAESDEEVVPTEFHRGAHAREDPQRVEQKGQDDERGLDAENLANPRLARPSIAVQVGVSRHGLAVWVLC